MLASPSWPREELSHFCNKHVNNQMECGPGTEQECKNEEVWDSNGQLRSV